MGRGRGVPLWDRPVVTGPSPRPARRPPTRHCWVDGPPDHFGPWPGVVVEWRHTDDDWSALVVYVVTEHGTSTTVQTWLPATFLKPALPG